MHSILRLIEQYGVLVVFANVLVEQLGMPRFFNQIPFAHLAH